MDNIATSAHVALQIQTIAELFTPSTPAWLCQRRLDEAVQPSRCAINCDWRRADRVGRKASRLCDDCLQKIDKLRQPHDVRFVQRRTVGDGVRVRKVDHVDAYKTARSGALQSFFRQAGCIVHQQDRRRVETEEVLGLKPTQQWYQAMQKVLDELHVQSISARREKEGKCRVHSLLPSNGRCPRLAFGLENPVEIVPHATQSKANATRRRGRCQCLLLEHLGKACIVAIALRAHFQVGHTRLNQPGCHILQDNVLLIEAVRYDSLHAKILRRNRKEKVERSIEVTTARCIRCDC